MKSKVDFQDEYYSVLMLMGHGEREIKEERKA